MAIALKEKRKVVSNEPFIVERPDGFRKYFIPHPEPIFDLDGNLVGATNMLVDVTESIFAEEQRAMLAAIIRSTTDAIISKNLDGIITSWNEAAEAMYGYTAQEMIGQSILKLFPADRKTEEKEIIKRIKKGEQIKHFETKRLRKDGTVLDVSVSISAIKDSKGNVIGASKIARDITQQKKAGRLIREKEEHLRMAIESAKLGTWEYDPSTFKLTCSEESRKICGIPEDLSPDFQLIASHIYKEDLDIFYQKIKSAIDPGKDGRFDMQLRIHRYGDREIRWVRAQGIVFFNTNKQPERLIGTMLDTTEEKVRELELRNSELLFKTISNAAPVGLWMADTKGQNTFVNDTWVQWTGTPAENQAGSGWLEKVLKEDKVPTFSKFLAAVEKKEKYTAEFRITRNDGQMRWCLTEGYPYYNINGELLGYAGSVTDITDMKTMEQRKDDFIKMASHELKTPITSINGYVQLLLNIYNEQPKEDEKSKAVIKTSLLTIAKQVAKLTRLISELLDLSKIESGRLELFKTEFDLEELVEETVQEARQTTSRHAVIFSSDYDGKVFADRDRISQILANLLNNAIKYSPDADKVEVFLTGNGKFVTIQVRDHGIGIDKKDQQKIFDRFYRVEGKDELTFPGFGIGLFITSEIVQRHQGSITVKSEKNKGSIFTVTLPIQTNGIKQDNR
jgi:PAS domain S-box-containing protein